jgi:peptidoglycan L-alanyl-D-glutamate endopeptidase CwlK
MRNFKLSKRSLDRLVGVHPSLVLVVQTAITLTEIDFVVTEGLRTPARQSQLMDAGASMTMNSRHITGHAVDLAAWVDGTVRWDWPLYHKLGAAMKRAAKIHNVDMEWGGDWRTFKDGPHFQLTWKSFP